MFPLYDENPTELPPIFTAVLMGISMAVWVLVQGAGLSEESLVGSVCAYGAIPSEITGAAPAGPGLPQPCQFGGLTWGALLTSMFLHGSWMHLVGNLWFLWIFGNNIEDSMGHLRFLAFYLLTGLVAAGTHVWSDPDSILPMVGASGAISGIMGAYLVLYPRARVHTLLFLVVLIRVIPFPAWFILGYWFLIQVLSGAMQDPATGGVAFMAHVGGFVAGAVLGKLFENPVLVEAKRAKIRLPIQKIRYRGWL